MSSKKEKIQSIIDAFAKKHGKCCAGCDHWRWHNSLVGDCIQTVPVSGSERLTFVGMSSISAPVAAGHIVTPRDHCCGQYVDTDQVN